MKKIILSAVITLTMGVAALANIDPVNNSKAQEVFKKEFAGAEMVKWSTEGNYSKVSFVLGGTSAIALFNGEGELLGSVRNIFYNQLPLSVITSFEKRFENATVIDITEVTNVNGTRYKVTMEYKNKKASASLYSDGTLENLEKQNK
ncbi:MAG TPA: hypothetical protein VF487_05640 [Chitinophagaceae bacterium]